MCSTCVEFLRLAKKIEEKEAVKLTSSAVEESVDRNENQQKDDHWSNLQNVLVAGQFTFEIDPFLYLLIRLDC